MSSSALSCAASHSKATASRGLAQCATVRSRYTPPRRHTHLKTAGCLGLLESYAGKGFGSPSGRTPKNAVP